MDSLETVLRCWSFCSLLPRKSQVDTRDFLEKDLLGPVDVRRGG